MSNFKKIRKIIAKILIFSFSLLICFYSICLLLSGMHEIWINGCRYLRWDGVGLTGVLSSVGIIGIIVSFAPKRRPPKILFYSVFLFLVIMIVSLLTNILPLRGHDFHFHALNQESLNSSVRVPSCAETSTERQKNNNTNIADNKDETDNIKTNTEENNEDKEETKITWKKYTNPLYGFSFEYPDYLKITEDKENDSPFVPKGYWQIGIESADYEEQAVVEEEPAAGIDIISGFNLSVYASPSTDATTFEELKEIRQLGRGGFPIIKEETRENNLRKFFIQTTQETLNDLHWSVGALYNPKLKIGWGIGGTKENKEEMETILNHFIETFE